MIVMCPGCSGVDVNLIKKEFNNEKIVFGCIGECGGRMDEVIVAIVNGEYIEGRNEQEFIQNIKNVLN